MQAVADIQPVDYTARDYASMRQAMLDDAATKLPEWTSRSANDYGVVFIEEFAYIGDILSYYIDRLVNESYIGTATARSSLLNLAAMLDYRPDTGRPATVILTIGVLPGSGTVFIPARSQFSSESSQPDVAPVVIFETDADLYITQSLTDVAYGTVTATQGTTVADESLGNSDGTADQRVTLATKSVIEGSVTIVINEGSGPENWSFTEHLIDVGPESPMFTTSTDAFGVTTVVFGDGINGRIPASGAPIVATYRVGGGTIGNVGGGSINVIVSAPPSVTSVLNTSDAVGGTDPETNDQIRVNAPRALSALHRAVTLDDFGNLSLQVTGVAKANATGVSYTNINLYVAPTGGGAPSAVLLARVSNYLANKKMVNASVVVNPPVYVPIAIDADVYVADGYAQSAVTTAARNALTALMDFDNVDFGMRITVSDVYAALAATPGVAYSVVNWLGRFSDPPGVADVVLAANEIPTLQGGVANVGALGGGIPAGSGGSTGSGNGVIPGAPGAPTIDSIACGTAHAFTLTCHWAAATNATAYNVLLDFYLGGVYKGSLNGGSYSVTNAVINNTFAGADTVHVHVQAVNGENITDGPVTSSAYACG